MVVVLAKIDGFQATAVTFKMSLLLSNTYHYLCQHDLGSQVSLRAVEMNCELKLAWWY